MRVPKETKTQVDITKPVKISAPDPDSCFGREWNMRTNECCMCADNILCGIVYSETTLKNQVKEVSKDGYLDQADFTAINLQQLKDFIKSGKTTTNELVAYVTEKSKCIDEVAVVAYIKRLIKEHKIIYTKDAKVWLS